MMPASKQKTAVIFTLTCGLILVACNMVFARKGVDPSFVSAVTTTGKGETVPVDPSKLKSLSEWFENHRRGWNAILATYPACNRSLKLVYADGRTIRLEICDGGGLRGTLQLFAEGPEDNAVQKVPEDDFEKLLRILQNQRAARRKA
jgi:hypothetical protein